MKKGGPKGLAHPMSKPVITEDGVFGSMRLAAKHYGMAFSWVAMLARRGSKPGAKPTGFRYI